MCREQTLPAEKLWKQLFFNPNMIDGQVFLSLHLMHIEKESLLFTDGNGKDKPVCFYVYFKRKNPVG